MFSLNLFMFIGFFKKQKQKQTKKPNKNNKNLT